LTRNYNLAKEQHLSKEDPFWRMLVNKLRQNVIKIAIPHISNQQRALLHRNAALFLPRESDKIKLEGEEYIGEGGAVNQPITSSRYHPSTNLGIDPRKPHILASQRKNRLIFMPDREILENSSYPAEYPTTEIPVPEPEVPNTRGRRILNFLYTQFREMYNRHRNVVWFNYINPYDQFSGGNWIAPSATVIGNVWLGDCVSVWYNAVLRADLNEIEIGGYTNVQDGVIITVDDQPDPAGFNSEVNIGSFTTIGHHAVLHGCRIGDYCVIGMNATILEGAVIEDECIIAAGSIVPPGRRIPSGEMWGGKPARFIRKVTENEMAQIRMAADVYYQLSIGHSLEFTSNGFAYKYVEKLVNETEECVPEQEKKPEALFNQWEQMNKEAQVPFWKVDRFH